jgi:Fe-S-cluster containining protein
MRESDIRRWRTQGREDILHILERSEPIWAGDHMISAQGREPGQGCIFLEYRDGTLACSIYETRPEVCREFMPGSSRLCRLYGD